MSSIRFPVPRRGSTLQRNLLLDLSSSIGLGTTMALVGALLPSLARHEGLGGFGLAFLAAVPFAASLLSIVAGRIGPRTPRGLALVRAFGSAVLILVFFTPDPLVIALATFVFWAMFSLGTPLQQRLWAAMYPSDRRGRLLGIVGTGRFAAGTLALLATTLLIDGAGGLAIVAVVAGLGVLSALATSRLRLPDLEPQEPFGMTDTLRSILRSPVLRSVTMAQILFGAGVVGATPFIAMVHIDRLALGLDDVALAGLTAYATTAAAFGFWGRVANRLGGLPTIALGAAIGAAAVVMFGFAPNLAGVLLASAVLGAAGAAIDVSWPLIIADHASFDEQSQVAAGINAIMGARGLVMPIVMMVPVSMGLLDITSGLVVCGLLAGSGALVYVRLAGIRLPMPRRVPARPLASRAVTWPTAAWRLPAWRLPAWRLPALRLPAWRPIVGLPRRTVAVIRLVPRTDLRRRVIASVLGSLGALVRF